MRADFRDKASVVDPQALPTMLAKIAFDRCDEAWLAPVHHWAAELDHGSGSTATVFDDPSLCGRRQADAIAFDSSEALASLAADLLPRLGKSDFTLLLPGVAAVATLHHHRQIWWRAKVQV